MSRTRRWLSLTTRAGLVVAVAAAWVTFAPLPFGGQTGYVIVAGASMEPALHQGDLVLTRPAPAYQVGQVVAYHHPLVGPVIHRIIGIEKSRYVLQGDHNTWIDSYTPSAEEVIGASWIALPRLGSVLSGLRTPVGLALFSLLFGAILVSVLGSKPAEDRSKPSADAMKRNRLPEGWLFVVAILGLGGLLLAIYAFSRPIVSPVSAEIPYQQNGAFNYGSAAPATVYAGSHLQTGDPIYDSLVPTFEVTFDYSLATAASAKMSGTSSLRLRVSEPNGWSRELPLQPETAFVGQAVTARGTADLRTVRRMISLLENATGVDRDAYWVDVLADVEVQGQMDGHPFQASFAPHLPFALDDDQLYLLTGDGPNATDTDPTRPNAEGSVSYLTLQPATLTILGAEVPVTTARGVAVLALLASLAGLVALLLPAYQARRAGGAAPILLEYGSAIVAVGGPPPTGPGGMIDVRSFDDLARLAERTGQTILDFEVGGEHHFYLRDGEVVYHLAVPAPAPPPAGQE